MHLAVCASFVRLIQCAYSLLVSKSPVIKLTVTWHFTTITSLFTSYHLNNIPVTKCSSVQQQLRPQITVSEGKKIPGLSRIW